MPLGCSCQQKTTPTVVGAFAVVLPPLYPVLADALSPSIFPKLHIENVQSASPAPQRAVAAEVSGLGDAYVEPLRAHVHEAAVAVDAAIAATAWAPHAEEKIVHRPRIESPAAGAGSFSSAAPKVGEYPKNLKATVVR